VKVVEEESWRSTPRFHCWRNDVVTSGLSVLGDGGGVRPPVVGNGLSSVNSEVCVGKKMRTLNSGGLKYSDELTTNMPES
jgi:hypothetical protein